MLKSNYQPYAFKGLAPEVLTSEKNSFFRVIRDYQKYSILLEYALNSFAHI